MTRSFRFSRYDPDWRDVGGVWPVNIWTDISDTEGDERLRSEYDWIESLLCDAALACLEVAHGQPVEIRRVEISGSARKSLRAIGASIDLPPMGGSYSTSDLTTLFRANLRGQVWCEFVGEHSLCAVGHEMYVHVLADSSERAKGLKERVTSMGLFVETVDYPWDDGPDGLGRNATA